MTDARAIYAQRLAERSAAWERWSYWDRRLSDIRLAAFIGILIGVVWLYQDGRPAAIWLGLCDCPVRRPVGGPRADPAEGGAGAAGGRFLYPGTGPRRGAMGGDRGGRPRIPRPRSSLRRRPGPVRPRLDVRATLHGADANRRGGAGLVAARPGRARRRSPNATGRSTSCGPGWTCARTSSSSGPRSGRGSTRTPWRPGARQPRAFGGWALPLAAAVLALFGTAAVIGWLALRDGLPPHTARRGARPGLACRHLAARPHSVLADVDQRTHDLVLLSELLARLEREPFETPLLRRLARGDGGRGDARLGADPPARPAAQPARRARRNQFFAPFAALWQWTTFFTILIDAWRGEAGPEVARWIRAVGEFEALCALGAYAAENPARPVPGAGARPGAL